MNFLFPYKLVPKDSKIIIYGAGEVGKDFYLQLNMLDNYYDIKAWVDKSFDDYEVNAPFDYVKNIVNYDYDYVVIAVIRQQMANSIKNELESMGISKEKIIWSKSYYLIGHELVPKNKIFLLKNLDFVMELLEEYWSAEAIFGGEKFYQSFKELGIEGMRSTGERISLYHIKDFINPGDEVLDIGCNCGFFAMQVAPYVKKVVGYEIEPKFVNIANKVSKFLNIENVEFRCENFLERKEQETYNIVFSFAIHNWIMKLGFSEEEFIEMIYNLLKKDGYLFFDSHALQFTGFNKQYRKLSSMFVNKGMKVCLHQNYQCDFEREIIVFQKID